MNASSQTPPQTQTGAAMALVQLLQEHPELHKAEWSLPSITPALRGFLYGGDLDTLARYFSVVGGRIIADSTYEYNGETLRRHLLKTTWRDVRIELVVTLPVAVEAVAA